MFCTLFTLAIFMFPHVIDGDQCPAEYYRFSRDHSMCLQPNPTCMFYAKGLQDPQKEIAEILEAHNDYRSRVAMGQEKLAGGLPTASNMIELTWDEELAEISQKWAEQCYFEHECGGCRASRSFYAGQNLLYQEYLCRKEPCEVKKPEWKHCLKYWYSEVSLFDKKLVKAMVYYKIIAHFTQVVWAETYRVGCGYVAYRNGNYVRHYYVCDYGTAANAKGASMYKEGPPCSKCPLNSCCGGYCHGIKTYPGLCHLQSFPPKYPPKRPLLFSCDFQRDDPYCQFNSYGSRYWDLVETPGGTFLSITLNEEETAMADFRQPLQMKKGSCMVLHLRQGPTIAGEKNDGKLAIEFEQDGEKTNSGVWSFPSPDFMKSTVWMDFEGYITFAVKFSVPAGSPPQFVEIKDISITEDSCVYQEPTNSASQEDQTKTLYLLIFLLLKLYYF